MLRADNRAITHAAMASLALHALVLSLTVPPPIEAPRSAAPAMVARMVEETATAEAPAPVKMRALKRGTVKPVARETTPSVEVPAMQIADGLSVAQYRFELISAAVRHKWRVDGDAEGDVLVRLTFAASGVAEVSVKRSSGRDMLDEQALEMFRRAAADVPVPPGLRGAQFGMEVRASYALAR